MNINRKSANVIVAGVLTLAVVAAGVIGYGAKIQADSITPGYATAKVVMKITVPKDTEISVNATFTPTDKRTKKYYFKNRAFTLKGGVNLVSWYIKKIPGSEYTNAITSNLGNFDPSSAGLSLISDKVTETTEFSLDLGMPKVESTAEATPAASESTTIASPPTPSLDSQATTSPQASATAIERIPEESIPSIPTLPS